MAKNGEKKIEKMAAELAVAAIGPNMASMKPDELATYCLDVAKAIVAFEPDDE